MNRKILLLTFTLLSAVGVVSCIEKPIPIQTPTLLPTETPKPIVPIPTTPIPTVIETPLPSEPPITEKMVFTLIREKNLREYYLHIRANPELQQHLKYGKFVKSSPLIDFYSEQLWDCSNNFTIIHPTVKIPTEIDAICSENPIIDYVNRTLIFLDYYIRSPATQQEWNDVYRTMPSDMVILRGYGLCDEYDVLFKSLMIKRGIPTQIRVLQNPFFEWQREYPYKIDKHTIVWVYVSYPDYKWVIADPTVGLAGIGKYRMDFNLEITPTKDITELCPYDAWYNICAREW